MRTIFNSLNARVMFIDNEYNIVYMNDQKIMKNPNVKIGMKCYNSFEEYGMRCPFCVANKAIETGKIQTNEDYVAIHKGIENPVHLSITSLPVVDKTGENIGAIEIAYDTENLYQTNIRLERLNKEYEHVIYALSHDLRAPLVSIEGFLAKLVRNNCIDLSNETAEHCLERIHVNVKMMNDLVKVLLDTSRITTGSLEIQDVNIEYLANSVVEQLQAQFKKSNVKIEFNFGTKTYRCDKIRTQQVFHNLVENSLDHGKEVPNLKIEIGSKMNTFWVADNGPGIPQNFKYHVFDAFSQSSKSGTGHFGMGMNIVYKIIEKHGGKIWIDSTEGKGTTIYFTLRPL